MDKNEKYITSMWYSIKTDKETLANLWGFVSNYYVSINLNENESLSFSNSDVILDKENNILKLRFKLTEKDLITPRNFKILNKESKQLKNYDFNSVIEMFKNIGFTETKFDFEEKIKMFEDNKKNNYNK